MSLEGQVALVVGGASGIGLATAKELLREGANVAVCDVAEEGKAVVQELQVEFGPKNSIFFEADVRDEAQFEAAFSSTKNHFKRLDIVINSAGIANDFDWSLEVDVNLKGVIRGTLLAWKYMGKQEGGSGGIVVNIASITALMSMHISPIYFATKYGVMGFSRCAGEPYHVNRTNVRVMTVCPGQTDTPLVNKVRFLIKDLEEELKKVKSELPPQKASSVAKGIVHVINNGKSGSVWVSEEDKPAWEVVFPEYKDMCTK